MKRATILFTVLWLTLGAAAAGNPKADPRAVVEAGNARFTVLTPQLIRMEWSEDGRFEDRATLTFVNRETPVPDFKVRDTKSRLTITTPALTLTYTKGGKFSDKNLKAVFRLNGREVVWTPGTEDPQNLMGTTRTLDGCDGRKLGREPMEQGLLSRAGWSVVDDSGRHVLTPDGSAWKEWVEARPAGDRQDLYLFAYGHDYKQALADFQLVAGRAPLPPKYTFGYWWSRYWQYSDNEFVDLVQKLKSVDIPIDVLIVDMDWHETWGLRKKNPAKDEYGQRIGWTGYTWQKELFPSPANFLRWTENEQLKVALNLHPASGIQPYEDVYEPFTREYGWTEKGKSVPFHIDEQKWADAYFKTVLNPMERQGVDFWWLDWQQNYLYPEVRGYRSTSLQWINELYYRETERKGLRGAGYSRWAGWGDHRHPIQFSGDAQANWEMLAFEVKLTAASGNAGCYYWAHDIGGFRGDPNPELTVRWTQFGALSAALRVHSTKDARLDRRPWISGERETAAMRRMYHMRSELMPYVYSSVWQTHSTMVPLNRPMYIEYGGDERAYCNEQEFLFGDLLLAAPIASPGTGPDKVASQRVWFPGEDVWYDFFTHERFDGGRECEISKPLEEFPLYVRGGWVLPMQPYTPRPASTPLTTLVMRVYPSAGDADNTYTLYEDDGVTRDYEQGAYATTQLNYRRTGRVTTVTVRPTAGSYEGQVVKRAYRLQLPAAGKIERAKVGGRSVKPVFDEKLKCHVIEVPAADIRREVKIEIIG